MIKEITMNDIKATGDIVVNKVRKAWVAGMPDEYKEKIKAFPSLTKKTLYKQFDTEVHQLWTDLLAEANAKAKENGAKLVGKDGLKHFEDEHCVNPDQLLIQAATEFLVKFVNENPLNEGTV